jgi:hypothetical protein
MKFKIEYALTILIEEQLQEKELIEAVKNIIINMNCLIFIRSFYNCQRFGYAKYPEGYGV